jgi:thiamine monophosphate kinase
LAHLGLLHLTGHLQPLRNKSRQSEADGQELAGLKSLYQALHLAYQAPQPPLEFAQRLPQLMSTKPINTGKNRLVQRVNAAIDVSDGLIQDATHLAEASHMSIVINVEALPSFPRFEGMKLPKAWKKAWSFARMAGGDDYQLLFCAPKALRKALIALAKETTVTITPIGEVIGTNQSGKVVLKSEHRIVSKQMLRPGYRHF